MLRRLIWKEVIIIKTQATTILVVEDDPHVARDIGIKLKALDYRVCDVVDNASDAIKQAKLKQPDLVLMDIVLPGGMDGIEAAAAIRKQQQIPVIYLTAYSDQVFLDRAKVTNPLAYILKPASERDLLAAITIAVQQADNERQNREREWLDATLVSLADALFAWNKEGRIIRVNRAAQVLLERAEQELLGRDVTEVLRINSAVDQHDVTTKLVYLIESQGGIPEDWDLLLQCEHRQVPVRVRSNRILNLHDQCLGYALLVEDDSERRQAVERLRQSDTVFECTQEGIMMLDAAHRIVRVNSAFRDITGYAESEIIGQSPAMFNSGRQGRDFYASIWTRARETGHWQGEVWKRRKDGEVFPVLLSISTIRNVADQISGYVGVFADISALKASEAQLEYLAHHDPLTRLPNRLLLMSRLEHGIRSAQRERKNLGVLMLDLDRFKDVNDSFGHLAGDELLQQVATRLTAVVRGVDTVTRLGGDEFTIVLENIGHDEDAARVAGRVIDALNQPFQLSNGAEVRAGASIGISLYPAHGRQAEELLQHADAALYQAKSQGRGQFAYFTETLTRAARERIDMEARLRRAIERNELCVYYQPQIDIATGRITGAEALVRWNDPQEGLIPPLRFIPVAEQTGLINAVGEWVLNETCRQGRSWLDAGLPALSLAVNVSPHQFMRSNLVETVSGALKSSGFPATSLELELTESALMARQQEAVDTLNQLRELGVRLAIDDFGMGYSSLAYLKQFPLDVLKIDKSFIDDIPASADGMEITAAIVGLAYTLRFKVLAEGVETAEQLAFLKNHGCNAYQGYLKSPPLPPDDFIRLLSGNGKEE